MAPSPTLKLTYFDVAARAETTRILLRLGGIPFDDERIARADFASLKPTLPYGHLPVLEVEGERIAETQAIARYAARISGFYPENDPVAALLVEEILTTINDMSETKMVPIIREQNPEKKKQRLHMFLSKHLPTTLTQLEARLQHMAKYPYFQENATQLHAHEIVLSTFVSLLQNDYRDYVPVTATEGYATITSIHTKVLQATASLPLKPQECIKPIHLKTASASLPIKLKLTYLDVKARGEFLRLALHIGGVPFEDERVTYEEITKRKATLPYGQVPVLDIDGVVVAQSFALLRYAGMLSGLYPVDQLVKTAKMDEIISRVEEFYHAFQASFEEKDPATRRTLREQLLDARVLQNILLSLEKRVTQWKQGSTYIFGEDVSIADLAVYHLVDFLTGGEFDYVPVTIVDEFTTLKAVRDAVLNHPRVHDWYATKR